MQMVCAHAFLLMNDAVLLRCGFRCEDLTLYTLLMSTYVRTTHTMVAIRAIDEVNYTSFDEGSFRRHPMTLLWTTDSMVVIRAIDEVDDSELR